MANHTPEEWRRACERAEAVMQEAEQKAKAPKGRGVNPGDARVMFEILYLLLGPVRLQELIRRGVL